MMSLVLSQPQGAVRTRQAKRKIPAAGMTKAKARQVAESILDIQLIRPETAMLVVVTALPSVGAAGEPGLGAGDWVGRFQALHTRRSRITTSATISGKVSPKFTTQNFAIELEKPASLCSQPG